MQQSLKGIILSGTLLLGGEINTNNSTNKSINETKTNIYKIITKNKKINNIRGYKIYNPGGKMNDDIKNSLISLGKIIDEYLPENISLKGNISTTGQDRYVNKSNTGNSLTLFWESTF